MFIATILHSLNSIAILRVSPGLTARITTRAFLPIPGNFTPVPRNNYRIGVPTHGFYKELLNSDASEYGGSGLGNFGGLHSDEWRHHGHNYSISITLPPLSMVVFKAEK
jgi:1,4-alpha-glucan branching enzyme